MRSCGCNDYLSIFNAVNDAIFIHNIETGNILDVNLKGCEMYGYTVDELKGAIDIIACEPPPYSKDDALQRIRAAISEGPQIFEWRARDKAGRSFWVEVNLKQGLIGGKDVILAVVRDISDRKRAEEMLKILEETYRSVFDAANDAIVINDVDKGIVDFNRKTWEMLGYTSREEALAANLDDALLESPPYCKEKTLFGIKKAYLDGPQLFERVSKHKSGRKMWVEVNLKRATVGGSDKVIAVVRDITERKRAEDRYRHLADSLPEVIFEIDLKGNLLYVNRNAFNFFGATQEDFDKGIAVFDYIVPEDRSRVRENIIKILNGVNLGGHEYTAQRKDGSRLPIIIHSNAIIEDGRPVGFRGIIIDISERKKLEEQLSALSLHDSLTGLYNRAYFEQKIKLLSKKFCLAVCDVDGLKLVNDTLGHDIGDKLLISAARLLTSKLREKDIVARIGGDEFALILPDCDPDAAEAVCARIQKTVAAYNDSNPNPPLSISIGFSCGVSANILDIFKEADNNMYREKLHRSKSARSAIVQTLMKALEARDYITEGHADRLQDLVVKIGESLGMSERNLSDLRLFARFHDFGKVGVPDRILFKKGPLTEEEMLVMRRHCEIGHRIAQSAPDLVLISDWILKHHEWWNGEGYPLGLKGEQIPLECRILAVADAFDAMTSNRPYRTAMSSEAAKKELVRYAGTQFDPKLVFKIIDLLS